MPDKTSFRKIANAYYNMGLERAERRDLSGAAVYLKEALHYNKYCTDARNLIGLIFYEMGETADALVQWIISLNLQPDDNLADYYLGEIQRKTSVIENDSELVKRFNQALNMAQNGSEDFAKVELQDICRKKPNFVKAELLLALLHMQSGEYKKAGSVLLQVLKIDHNNPQGCLLMEEVKRATGKDRKEQKRLESVYSHRELEDDDVIIPETKTQTKPVRIVLYLLGGFVLGVLGFYILILPTIRRGYIQELNNNIAANSSELSTANAELSKLQEKYDALSSRYDDASAKLNAYENENAAFTDMYEKLNKISDDFSSGDIESAVTEYLSIDRSLVTSEPLLSQLQNVDRLILNDGFSTIVEQGTASWNGGALSEAERLYKMALSVKPDDPEAMFLLARLLQSQDRISEANALFDRIVGEHPESQYAERAISARGY